jgi:hypothetical protein
MREQLRPHRSILLAGVGAALLCNFWVLEDLLAKRNDLSGAWISDLAARSQVYGWRFQILEVAAGLAVAAFAALLLTREDKRSPLVRRGLWALLAAGVLAAIGGAAPLNCAEALERACDLSYDPFDVIHTSANLLEIVAVALAFALVGVGLTRPSPPSPFGRATLALGALWLALAALTGLSYLSADADSAKGIFQRADQVVFGAWLVLLGIWAATAPRPAPAGPGDRGATERH